jgi:hypothetical protein
MPLRLRFLGPTNLLDDLDRAASWQSPQSGRWWKNGGARWPLAAMYRPGRFTSA